uniref:Uncharacterized protein n=1 Tax=Cacopsylla melanoneura TaxID=428564 RepID=A0A8D9ELQ0_9HEMI
MFSVITIVIIYVFCNYNCNRIFFPMITIVIVIFFCDYDYIFPVISIIITIFYDYDPNHEFFMITTVITTFLLIAAVITNTFFDFTITVAIIRVYDYCCNRNRNHISKRKNLFP